MYNSVVIDVRTHFKARYKKLVVHLLGNNSEGRKKAGTIVHSSFMGDWSKVNPGLAEKLKGVLPMTIERNV